MDSLQNSPAPPAVALASFSGPIMSTQRVVLVVEDEPALVSIFQRALEQQGYRVLTATSGEEALRVADSVGGRIDLLLSDIVMPGMGGRELVWRMRTAYPDLPVILVSGYTTADGALQMMEDLGVVFVAKPMDLGVLLATVREAVGDAGS
jgi:two-component system, cell cycle sensor histidine kinase and response regulator CckA